MSELTQNKFLLPSRYEYFETSIWQEYAKLKALYNPIDLGVGFPDFLPCNYVTEALQEVAKNTQNSLYQYTRGAGHPRLVQALSRLYSTILQRQIDPFEEICTSLGGYHAIFLTVMSLVDSGDEVILVEPFFDAFAHNVKSAGGVARLITLKPKNTTSQVSSDWSFDSNELEGLFNEKTKAIIINTPHNPCGKVFTYDELAVIANLCKTWNVVCISDEVYEFMVYDGKKHPKIATLPEMWERTITISSAGKTFGVTGWKVGWVYGPKNLIKNVQIVHHNCIRAGNTFLQEVVAICIEKVSTQLNTNSCHLLKKQKQMELKRNFMVDFLSRAGFKPVVPDGGYFMVADWSNFKKRCNAANFVDFLAKEARVQAMTLRPYYTKEHSFMGETLIRFCFAKSDTTLSTAAHNLEEWSKNIQL